MAIFLGAPTEAKADPTVTDYIPRPEWYFLWLFRFLSLLKPQLEVLGTVALPVVGILVLVFLPMIDRNRYRHPLDRPIISAIAALVVIGIGILTYQGATAPVPQAGPITRLEIPALTPIEQEGFQAYKDLACGVCHAINGVGGTRGPDLAGVGARLQPGSLLTHIQPAPGTSTMPTYQIPNETVLALAAYLETLTTPPSKPVATTTPLPVGEADYIEQGCPACHSINGIGGTLGPDLTNEGNKHDKAFIEQYLQNPSVVIPNSTMPAHPMPPDVLDRVATYVASLKGGILAGGPSAAAGQALYQQLGCSACHAINGVGGNQGPELTHVGDTRDATFLEKFIKDPKSLVPGATMPPYANLNDAELQSIALYLLSLVGKAPTPAPVPTAAAGPTPTQAAGAGAALYATDCQACHGPQGQGGAVYSQPITSASYLSSHTDEQIRTVIQNGEGAMPPFGSRLRASDVDAIIAQLRAWQY
jgi:mono/diheme cytochrome c family protein